MLCVLQWLTLLLCLKYKFVCTMYVYVCAHFCTLSIHPSIYPSNQPVSHAESTVLNVKLKENILSKEEKKNEETSTFHWFFERNIVFHCEHRKLAAFDIKYMCMRRDAVCLLINSHSFLFIFFPASSMLCLDTNCSQFCRIEFHLMGKTTILFKWKAK